MSRTCVYRGSIRTGHAQVSGSLPLWYGRPIETFSGNCRPSFSTAVHSNVASASTCVLVAYRSGFAAEGRAQRGCASVGQQPAVSLQAVNEHGRTERTAPGSRKVPALDTFQRRDRSELCRDLLVRLPFLLQGT